MPVREIKTTLKIDGEKEFKKELADASREMRVLDAALKASAAEFEAGGTKQAYYTKRAETLNNQIRQQQEIIDALTREVSGNADAINDTSAAMDGYRIKLSNATAKMFDLRKEAEAANKELEELGRDSGRVGQQIERGIGDAAEEVADKLDGMFAKVASDVNALKGSVAFQTSMNVGEMVLDGIGTVVDFVNENQELNTRIAMTKYNVEKGNLAWDEIESLVVKAGALTGNVESGLEAVSHLAQLDFESKDLMESALDALMGAYIRTGGALSVESLAEDLRASVTSRVPTGTYAEVIEEVIKDVSVDEVTKALEGAASEREALEIAMSYLTEAGLQTTWQDYETQNAELQKAKGQQVDLALAWAALAEELQPYVTLLVEALTNMVSWTAEGITWIEEKVSGIIDKVLEFNQKAAEKLGMTDEEYGEVLMKGVQGAYGISTNDYVDPQATLEGWKMLKELIFPSAKAAGESAVGAMDEGMITAASESTVASEIIKGVISQMSAEDANANTAGVNLVTEFNNGVAAGAPIAVASVASMVSQINELLSQVGSVAYGAGFAATGGGVNLTVDGNDLSTVVSTNLGRKTQATLLVK